MEFNDFIEQRLINFTPKGWYYYRIIKDCVELDLKAGEFLIKEGGRYVLVNSFGEKRFIEFKLGFSKEETRLLMHMKFIKKVQIKGI